VHRVESIFKSWPLFLSRMKSKIQLLCSKEHTVGPYIRRFYLKSQQLPGYSEIRTVLWNLSVHHRVHIIRPHHQLEYPALNSKPCLLTLIFKKSVINFRHSEAVFYLQISCQFFHAYYWNYILHPFYLHSIT
jgi:hypothetical protein